MARGIFKLLTAALAVSAAASAAHAGGFSRGTADTDILYEEGNFNIRAGATIVAPQRGYETITSPLLGGTVSGTDGSYSDSYIIPSAAIKLNVTDDLRCALTQTEAFGAGASYGTQAITAGFIDGTGVISEGFSANEFAATCGYKFDLSKGRAWLLGGVLFENFDYEQVVRFAPGTPGVPPSGTGTLTFGDPYQVGYRIGAAYEIPEIALRAQIMYRSAVDHTPGNTSSDAFVVRTATGVTAASFVTDGFGTMPQSVELKVQSGIAPGWLAFASVKWTDWSVLDVLTYNIQGFPVNPRILEYFWRDGWTVTAGVGHAFTENISGAAGLTWDRGVSTTEDAFTDTYTLFAGTAMKDKYGGELRLGGAISYLTAGSVVADATPLTPGIGNSFAYTVGGDWAVAASASYSVKW
jgi:long-chain fatty acid transport protein